MLRLNAAFDCKNIFSGDSGPGESAACKALLSGNVDLGGVCKQDDECKSGGWCEIADGACGGGCKALRGQGALCPSSERCGEPLVCVQGDSLADPYTCVSRLAQDAKCGGDDQCQDGLFCQFGSISRCKPLGGAGADCENADECGASFFCNDASSECLARKDSGQPCAGSLFGSNCKDGLICAGPPASPTCRVGKKLGESCTRGNQECVFIGACNASNVCALAELNGPCGVVGGELALICTEGYCDALPFGSDGATEGLCRTLKPLNQPCRDSDWCQSGDCTSDVCVPARCP